MTEDDEAETTTKVEKGLYANDISRSRRYLVLDLMAEQGYIREVNERLYGNETISREETFLIASGLC